MENLITEKNNLTILAKKDQITGSYVLFHIEKTENVKNLLDKEQSLGNLWEIMGDYPNTNYGKVNSIRCQMEKDNGIKPSSHVLQSRKVKVLEEDSIRLRHKVAALTEIVKELIKKTGLQYERVLVEALEDDGTLFKTNAIKISETLKVPEKPAKKTSLTIAERNALRWVVTQSLPSNMLHRFQIAVTPNGKFRFQCKGECCIRKVDVVCDTLIDAVKERQKYYFSKDIREYICERIEDGSLNLMTGYENVKCFDDYWKTRVDKEKFIIKNPNLTKGKEDE